MNTDLLAEMVEWQLFVCLNRSAALLCSCEKFTAPVLKQEVFEEQKQWKKELLLTICVINTGAFVTHIKHKPTAALIASPPSFFF